MELLTETFTVQIPHQKRKSDSFQFPLMGNEKIYKKYKKIWTILQDNVKHIVENEYKPVRSSIIDEIKSFKDAVENTPTIFVLTDTCAPDTDFIFQNLEASLKMDDNCFIVSIDSDRDISVKYLVEKSITSLTSSFEEQAIVDCDNVESLKSRRPKKFHFTFGRLRILCEKISLNKQYKPLLLYIMPDFITLPYETMSYFLTGLRELKDYVKISLILGVPTNLVSLFKFIPDQVLQGYELRAFDLKLSGSIIDYLMDQVFLENICPFLLHGSILEDLILSSNFYNPSIDNFMLGIQACMINHFYGCNVSFLCCSVNDIPHVVNNLSEKQISHLLQLKSVGLLNSKLKENRQPLLKNDANVKKEILNYVTELHYRIARFNMAVRCLHSVWKFLPCSTTLKDLYCECMKHFIVKTKNFEEAFKSLNFLSLGPLLQTIQTIKRILSTSKDSKINKILERIEKFHQEITEVEKVDDSDSHTNDTPSHKSNTDSIENTFAVRKNIKNTTTRHSLLKAASKDNFVKAPSRSDFIKGLRENTTQLKKNSSKVDKIKREYARFLVDDLFSEFLDCPFHYPFNETVIYQNIPESRNVTKVNLKASVNRAFTCPADILDCDCCKLKESESFHVSWPDICISYKLYLESGLEINLHDWLQSFDSLVRGKENDDIPSEIYNRFLQTVKEFSFLGLIKPLKHKVDHVKKLKI